MGVRDATRRERRAQQWRRVRWRLRGDSARLTLVVLVLLDAALLTLLPVRGDAGPRGGWLGALPWALALNLLVAGGAGVTGAMVMRRRDPSLPRAVARDRAATLGMLLATAGLVGGGIAHRPAVRAHRAEIARVVDATLALSARNAPSSADRRRDHVDVRRWASGVYRACLPVGRPDRAWCAVVRVRGLVARAREDSDVRPNAAVGTDPGETRPRTVP